MKKMIKLSLVAAMSVASLNTVASAADVDYSGKLYVENYVGTEEVGSADAVNTSGFEIDFDVTGKAKVTDNLTAVVGLEADSDRKEYAGAANEGVDVDDAHFVYAKGDATVIFGRQAIDTPTTDGENGEGTLASYKFGNFTAVGAYFENNDVVASSTASALALLGKAGPVNLELWQVGVSDHSTHNTAVLSVEAAGWTIGGRLATSTYDAAGAKDGSTMIISAAGKVSNIGLTAALLTTHEDGAAFVTDASSANTAELVHFTAKGHADTTATIVTASMPVSDDTSVALKFGTASIGDDDTASEVVLQANYKLAKSTTLTARYASYTQDVSDVETNKTQGRVDLTYKF
ncbi:MAG: hypothetical protein U9R37_00365 [Campylobacterota bacterium]|nr:hypothetical protein [Campylobacterota bacterium]